MSEQLPFEDEWGFAEWLEFKPDLTHRTWRTSIFWCGIGNSPNCDGHTRDEAARNSVERFCEKTNIPLPFRPRHDLSTAEGCLRAITDAGGGVQIFSQRCNEREPIIVWRKDEAGLWLGQSGEPWTLDALQAAARYVLGMEAKADE